MRFLGIPIPATSSLARVAIGLAGTLAVLAISKLLLARFAPARKLALHQLLVPAVIVAGGLWLHFLSNTSRIVLRRVERPPPTTLAGLRSMMGPKATGACNLADILRDTSASTSITLADSTTLSLPSKWRLLTSNTGEQSIPAPVRIEMGDTSVELPRSMWKSLLQSEPTTIAGPDDSRIGIARVRYERGRSILRYRTGQQWPGSTCEIDRGDAGAIWTFYDRDQAIPEGPRPFQALGDVMARTGAWYTVKVGANSDAELARLTAIVTEAALRPSQ